jgi:hypothetical protein
VTHLQARVHEARVAEVLQADEPAQPAWRRRRHLHLADHAAEVVSVARHTAGTAAGTAASSRRHDRSRGAETSLACGADAALRAAGE